MKIHEGIATTFADPADIRAFKRCKAQGKTDQQCFKVGDNGIGCWGDDCTAWKPYVAVSPDYWKQLKNPRGAKVKVWHGAVFITAELRDTLPAVKNVTNGAVIDLNACAAEALGIPVPCSANVKWQFIGGPDILR